MSSEATLTTELCQITLYPTKDGNFGIIINLHDIKVFWSGPISAASMEDFNRQVRAMLDHPAPEEKLFDASIFTKSPTCNELN
jgi:hypothetical protein